MYRIFHRFIWLFLCIQCSRIMYIQRMLMLYCYQYLTRLVSYLWLYVPLGTGICVVSSFPSYISSVYSGRLGDGIEISRSVLSEEIHLIKDVDTGKSCGKESPEKKDETELWGTMEAQTAFLGPNLWEKTLPYDTDLKLEKINIESETSVTNRERCLRQYVDLDEFLSENGIPVEGGVQQPSSSGCLKEPGRASPVVSASQVLTKREPSPSPSEAMSPLTISPPSPAESTLSFASSSRDAFDPRTRAFSDEELKPQPMVKKSRKQDSQFVPEGLKDEKYWARRRKNNMAAKRSRDARRMKENQIALRAGFLEKENLGLRQEMDRLKKENLALRDRLSKFTNEI